MRLCRNKSLDRGGRRRCRGPTSPGGAAWSPDTHICCLLLQVPSGEAAGEVRPCEAVRLPLPQVGTSGGATAGLLLRQLQHQRGTSLTEASRAVVLLARSWGIQIRPPFTASVCRWDVKSSQKDSVEEVCVYLPRSRSLRATHSKIK